MLIKDEIINELYSTAGEERHNKAEKYVNQGRVSITKVIYDNIDNIELHGTVIGHGDNYSTYIKIANNEIEDVRCNCQDYENRYASCKHIVATALEFISKPIYKDMYVDKVNYKNIEKSNISEFNNKGKYRNFKQMINTFYNEEMNSYEKTEILDNTNTNVKIVPKFIFDKFSKELKVEFKIGTTQMYKLKNLTDFYDRMLNKQNYKYGNKLEFIHEEKSFEESSRPLLDCILKYSEIIKYVNISGNYKYYGKTLIDNCIVLTNTGIDDIFEVLKGKTIDFQEDLNENQIMFIPSNPNIEFKLEKINNDEYSIIPNIEVYDYTIMEGKKYTYILFDNALYRCTKEFKNTNLKLLEIFRKNFTKEIKFGKKLLPDFFSLVVPKLKQCINIKDENKEEIEKYIPEELGTKVFLDFDNNNFITAEIKFCYGDKYFNPLNTDIHDVPRNIIKETEALNMFRRTGFMLDKENNRFILVSDDSIYNFLANDIGEYMQAFEVLVTDNFKTKEIKQPHIGNIGIRVENNLLNLDFSNLGYNADELKEILNKYNIKKKYHRLKDGSFIELENNEDIEFLDNLQFGMDIDYKDIEKGTIKLPIYRGLYLNRLLEKVNNTEIVKDSKYKNMINNVEKKQMDEYIKVPKEMENILRYYQKIGYKWLENIEEYNLGGILADDMGLGKTIQILSVILTYIQNTKKEERLPSIVIAPSSLSLNWESETKKFAGDIKTLVINGKYEERKAKIESIKDYDLVVTSYDLLKRDIELYEENNYIFKYSIADEAQYIKNSNTQNSRCLKLIKAQTRYALTGTPIENSLSELWSIFDYIMPGYLFGYRKFRQTYEMPIVKDNDENALRKLKMMIEPFILRRVKKEVLKELPEKSISILKNEMEEEQLKIYLSYLSKAKTEALSEIGNNGFEKSQIKILALLTRLRQICCHPSLFIENYDGESSKLNQCMEIVKDATSSGHKILIFSVYSSMFEILEKKLEDEDIKYYKLTGQTKVDERVDLVDNFNENKDIKVFLISLKAGGTGLNLTGADMVIHYDPWWNISAENQATDRAYRIGQKNNVQVYKLITKNSIEEKIFELQEKKAKLIDTMLDTQATFVSKFSKDDIMSLFE